MQKLLDTFVNANGVNELTKLVNIFESEFDDEVERVTGKSAKADTILNAINAVVVEKMDSNPAFYKKISKQIQDIIEEYGAKRLSEEEKLAKAQKLKDIITGALKPNDDKYPNEFIESGNKKILCNFYDNLSELLEKSLDKLETAEFEEVIRNLAFKFSDIYANATKKPEWHKNSDVEKDIASKMQDCLWKVEDDYLGSKYIENKKEIYQVIRKIGINFYA
ncbi:hypothetical protein CCY99_08485 [Helicobacter sp. 16-1353]|uniref:hypothetical protein n=1 Tax=Helicobacter sp. 16-1353 TaxID=2004996 RepID=UPI000DCB8405|nr:hypothetical protein [Helicobacter sp. 16-1353]RAX51828.1 hypothetical protein CCY99_08485 [Helicobacter sp. 16-1353]